MNKQDKIDFIREKCVEANPEIKKRWVVDEVHDFSGKLTNGTPTSWLKGHYGLPIRLADVFLAMNKKIESENSGGWDGTERRMSILTHWNLRADDLREQSDATLTFIYQLLKITS